jgi:methionine synthase I (cobalamin-dependent)
MTQGLIDRILAEKGYILTDGATGTNMFSDGLEAGAAPELWNCDHPEKVRTLHDGFIAAGSDLILTNSFGGTGFRLQLHEAQNRVTELNKAAAMLARQAADAAGRPVIVAGSIGPTGELMEPLGALTPATAEAAFAEQAQALADGGADMIWIETMSSLEETEAAIRAAHQTGLPVSATLTFDTNGRSMMGVQPADFARFAEKMQLTAFGANCGIGPAELMDSVQKFGQVAEGLHMVAKGNCGIPQYVDGAIHYHGSPELMARYAVHARNAGARFIGGCCGTSVDHVSAMAAALSSTRKTDLDVGQLEADLGKPWAEMKEGDRPQRSRRSRRRRD